MGWAAAAERVAVGPGPAGGFCTGRVRLCDETLRPAGRCRHPAEPGAAEQDTSGVEPDSTCTRTVGPAGLVGFALAFAPDVAPEVATSPLPSRMLLTAADPGPETLATVGGIAPQARSRGTPLAAQPARPPLASARAAPEAPDRAVAAAEPSSRTTTA